MHRTTLLVAVDTAVLKKLVEAARMVGNVSAVPCNIVIKVAALDADLRHAVLVVGFELEAGVIFHELRGENIGVGGNLRIKFPIPLQFPVEFGIAAPVAVTSMAGNSAATTPEVEPSSWITVFRRLYQKILGRG